MEQISVFFNLESLEVAKLYLFGEVSYLNLLVLLMLVDIVTGILKAIKNKDLRSRSALFGYARKIAIFAIIIVANVVDIVDTILDLNGMVATATVLFYMANQILSITENAAHIGLKVTPMIQEKLRGFDKYGPEEEPKSEESEEK
ncbi:phage holin family protein [Alkalicoccobacillus murimartini]|uniref:Toxin secretion/phage lysis holin n=1 Tax=Alkalicoccobacillus murimartini TaxID=171685 RepID=A0ABT9YLV7_9BACI|nr:phage holin family protein [Alkalicoccobacillus murimartini]MDQ0208870.1 toxin secretion/phage lysis holin [Alkalicoccobacillus murimartini]